MKRKLAIMLAVILTLNICMLTVSAQRATASTLRLEAAEGEVTVTNKSAKELTVRSGMKLYNGYGLSTDVKSYGYIGLDEKTAVKLDAVSTAEIIQSGKKLEVDLKTGNLFFNVTSPLAEDESLNIRTSTMVTGIRGTSGWLEVLSERVAVLRLLTGEVTVTSTDPRSGETRQLTVLAGETVTSYTGGASGTGAEVELVKERFGEEDVPGFVAQEIKKDKALQEKITDETELDVPKIIGEADEKLASDEQKQEEAKKEAEQKQGELENEKSVDPLYEEPGTGGDTTGTVVRTTITLTGTGLTEVELQAALNSYATVIIDATAQVTISAGESVTIPTGKTLTNNGLIVMDTGASIINESMTTLNNTATGTISGGVIFNGGETLPGRAILAGYVAADIAQNPNSVLELTGSFTGTAVIKGGTATISGQLDGGNGSALIVQGGTVNVTGGTITSTGGSLEAAVAVTGGTLTLSGGTISASGYYAASLTGEGSSLTIDGAVIMSTGAGTTAISQTGGDLLIKSGIVSGVYAAVNIELPVGEDTSSTYQSGVLMPTSDTVTGGGTLEDYTSPVVSASINAEFNDSGVEIKINGYTTGNIVCDTIDALGNNQKVRFALDGGSIISEFRGAVTIGETQHVIFDASLHEGLKNTALVLGREGIINDGTLELIGVYYETFATTGAQIINNGVLNFGRADCALTLSSVPVINTETGVVNIRGNTRLIQPGADGVEMRIDSCGLLNVGDYELEADGIGMTIAGQGMKISNNGTFSIKGGATAAVKDDGIDLGADGTLELEAGALENLTGRPSCVSGPGEYLKRIYAAEGFTFTNDTLANGGYNTLTP